MSSNKKERIEIRFDPIKDKDMIEFIDNNGSTRAGFIKQVLIMYKNQIENTAINNSSFNNDNTEDRNNNNEPKKKKANLGTAFSSKDFQ